MGGSSVRVCLAVLNQGYCSSTLYNLRDRILQLDANATPNQSYALFFTLVNIINQSRDHSDLSIPGMVVHGSC